MSLHAPDMPTSPTSSGHDWATAENVSLAGAREPPGTRQHVCGGRQGVGGGAPSKGGGGVRCAASGQILQIFPVLLAACWMVAGRRCARPPRAPRQGLGWLESGSVFSVQLYSRCTPHTVHPAYLQCNLLKSNCVELAAVGLYKHPPPARARQSGMYLFIFKCSSR